MNNSPRHPNYQDAFFHHSLVYEVVFTDLGGSRKLRRGSPLAQSKLRSIRAYESMATLHLVVLSVANIFSRLPELIRAPFP